MLIKKDKQLIVGQYITVKNESEVQRDKDKIGLRVIGVYPYYVLFRDEIGIKHTIQNKDLIKMGIYRPDDALKGEYGGL